MYDKFLCVHLFISNIIWIFNDTINSNRTQYSKIKKNLVLKGGMEKRPSRKINQALHTTHTARPQLIDNLIFLACPAKHFLTKSLRLKILQFLKTLIKILFTRFNVKLP